MLSHTIRHTGASPPKLRGDTRNLISVEAPRELLEGLTRLQTSSVLIHSGRVKGWSYILGAAGSSALDFPQQ